MADAGDEGRARDSRPPLTRREILSLLLVPAVLGGFVLYLLSPADGDPDGYRSVRTRIRIGELSSAVEQLRQSQVLGHFPVADAAIGPGETNAGIEAAYAAAHDPAFLVRMNEDPGSSPTSTETGVPSTSTGGETRSSTSRRPITTGPRRSAGRGWRTAGP